MTADTYLVDFAQSVLRDAVDSNRPRKLAPNEARAILDHIAALEARAEKAEYELKRWKEVESKRPDWEKLWEFESNRADEAEAAADVFKAVNVLPAEPAAEWLEAMAREINHADRPDWYPADEMTVEEVWDETGEEERELQRCRARAAYAALARAMGGGDAE